MSLLSVSRLGCSYIPGVSVFRDASFEINPRDRIAVVGPNGCGKTSMLRLLAGSIDPDEGTVVRRRGLAIECLEQDQSPAEALSGGEKTRAALARLFRSQPDVLLLDEPTNHLDIHARLWLEQELLRFPGAAVFVSHDRTFLDNVATRVLRFERGIISLYTGNYGEALEQIAIEERNAWAAYNSAQRRAAVAERAALKRSRLASKVAATPADVRSGHDFYLAKAARVARTARILRERAAQAETVAKPWEQQPIAALTFPNLPRSGDPVATLDRVTFAYGERPVLADCSLHLRRGEKCVVLGPNGSGKSTLLRLLAGDLAPATGSLQVGHNVRTAHFAQEFENLDHRRSALDLCLAAGSTETSARTLLGCLRMTAADITRPLSSLSGGERTKTALARLFLSPYNLLLLDEPTNHLELEAAEALVDALDHYPGAALIATHDRALATRPGFQVLRL
jgi:ATPase subunit of ABC transporter with duplicated ATPase domains